VIIAAFVLALAGGSAHAAAPDTTRSAAWTWTQVTYLSGSSVYLGAGTAAGLREGTRVEVVRAGTTIAELVVAFVSSTRAACTIARTTTTIEIGDSARFVAPPPAVTDAGRTATDSATAVERDVAGADSLAPAPATSRTVRMRSRAVRGRLGARYFIFDPADGVGSAMTQPALDLRLDGDQIGGSPIGLAIDVRAHQMRQTSSGTAPRSTTSTRVYQAALSAGGARSHLTAGRQISPALAVLGFFDGVAAEAGASHWAIGALAGTQPDATDFGLSGELREYGAYLQLHNAARATGIWSLTAGAIGSYAHGEIDREFLYLQTLVATRHVSLYATQEVDYNRGWKRDAGEPTAAPTATFATLRVSLVDGFSVDGGIDDRRNVRLYRDRLNPEVEFDDSFRRGVWGGASLSLFHHLRLSGEGRTASDGSGAGKTESYTGNASLSRITRLGFGMRARATRYRGPSADGWLRSGSVEIDPFGLVHVEATAGRREDAGSTAPSAARLDWRSLDADLGLGRSWYLMVSAYRESGAVTQSRQAYAALSYRF
jgi:hypothetical protein